MWIAVHGGWRHMNNAERDAAACLWFAAIAHPARRADELLAMSAAGDVAGYRRLVQVDQRHEVSAVYRLAQVVGCVSASAVLALARGSAELLSSRSELRVRTVRPMAAA